MFVWHIHSFFLDFESFPLLSSIPDCISDLLAAPSLLRTTHSPASKHVTFPCLTCGWDFGKTMTYSNLESWGQKTMSLSTLFDTVEQQLSKYPPNWAWSIWNKFCISGWILPLSVVSPPSQILGAFHLARSFPWNKNLPALFPISPPKANRTCIYP